MVVERVGTPRSFIPPQAILVSSDRLGRPIDAVCWPTSAKHLGLTGEFLVADAPTTTGGDSGRSRAEGGSGGALGGKGSPPEQRLTSVGQEERAAMAVTCSGAARVKNVASVVAVKIGRARLSGGSCQVTTVAAKDRATIGGRGECCHLCFCDRSCRRRGGREKE